MHPQHDAMMDFKRLGHLLALADECHFARAAERVHLSQPAFSRSIQAIERDVGMRLFDREAGAVKPTPAGLFLIERARQLLFDARCLRRDTSLYRDSQLGDTAFGAGFFPAATLMPAVMQALRRQYPGVRLRLQCNHWSLLLERLLTEELEFFVADVSDLPADPRIEVQALGRQQARLFVRQGHPLAGQPCSFAQVWAAGLAGPKLHAAAKRLVTHLLGLPVGQEPVLAVECDELPLLRSLALGTDTVVAAPEAGLADDVQASRIVPLVVRDLPDVYSEIGLVSLRKRTPSPMAQHAIACIQGVAREQQQAAVMRQPGGSAS
jgi:DNA-binding transcriptional LysR family regulator